MSLKIVWANLNSLSNQLILSVFLYFWFLLPLLDVQLWEGAGDWLLLSLEHTGDVAGVVPHGHSEDYFSNIVIHCEGNFGNSLQTWYISDEFCWQILCQVNTANCRWARGRRTWCWSPSPSRSWWQRKYLHRHAQLSRIIAFKYSENKFLSHPKIRVTELRIALYVVRIDRQLLRKTISLPAENTNYDATIRRGGD